MTAYVGVGCRRGQVTSVSIDIKEGLRRNRWRSVQADRRRGLSYDRSAVSLDKLLLLAGISAAPGVRVAVGLERVRAVRRSRAALDYVKQFWTSVIRGQVIGLRGRRVFLAVGGSVVGFSVAGSSSRMRCAGCLA